jgi:hypothetical protein
MPLTSMFIDEVNVTPRGGRDGVVVTVPGSGFGSVAGRVRFDPLGEDADAVINSWVPNEVVFVVPVMSTDNRTVQVQIEHDGGSDSVVMPFWYPTPTLAPFPSGYGLGYQWPNAEAGSPQQDTDDPRLFTAADFNRLFDRIVALGAGGGGLPALLGQQFAVLMESPVGMLAFARLTEDMILDAFAVTLTGGGEAEVGDSVISPQFSAFYVRPPVVAVLTDTDANPPQDVVALSNPITRPHTYTKTVNNALVDFVVTANEQFGPSRVGQATWAWRPRAFWGVGAAGGATEVFIEALANSALAPSRARTFAVSPGPTEKIYYAYPTAYGVATLSVGGFVGGFLPPTTIAVTNPFGVTQSYYLYESALVDLGTTSVVAS